MATAPDPISAGLAISGVVVIVSATALARALLRRQARSHDDLDWSIIFPACGLLVGVMGLVYALIPL